MSIDLNWETLTTGADGLELAHHIRDFIHAKFQSVLLPRFIKSVTVHDFEFGSIPPEIELKDITDPLPDFYEENSEDGDDEDEGEDDDEDELNETKAAARRRAAARDQHHAHSLPPHINTGAMRSATHPSDLGSPFLGVSTPGIPGGTSNFHHHFHSHLASGLSGTQTPLAAVTGAHLGHNSWLEAGGGSNASATSPPWFHALTLDGQAPSHSRNPSQSSISEADFNPGGPPAAAYPTAPAPHPALREKHSVSTLAPTSAGTSRPPTRDASSLLAGSAIAEDHDYDDDDDDEEEGRHGAAEKKPRRFREPRVEDIQAVFRIRYAGDVKLLLTADILLDYPMPSFVGIPVKLSITGLTFDGVGVLAHMRKRVHFCFLSPDDALAAVGDDAGAADGSDDPASGTSHGKVGGLLQEIKVESEIGKREGGKQSLKNVGKVERFVLEQVRRIFEDEFVYPSFWTFLV